MGRISRNSTINRDGIAHKRKTPSRNSYDGANKTLTRVIYKKEKIRNHILRINDTKVFAFVKRFIQKCNSVCKVWIGE